jgi:large subunit ribosomal protein L9
MKVILNDYVEHVGERGDTVEVKPGFARNYLLPKGLAYPDTPGNRRRFEREQSHWEALDLKRRSAAEKAAHELDGVELLFERRAGERDVLFGSVTSVDIAKALADKGYEIDRRKILLDEPIKALGRFEVQVHIHRAIKVTVPLEVVRPGEQPGAAEAAPVAAEAAESEAAASAEA